jgi:EmrB/QacA subfamily drug resistance transporter
MTSPQRWTLFTVCLATFMYLLDITVVNVALPDIQRELHASLSDLQWVVDAYALMLAALLLTAGSLADLLGRRLVFVTGLVLFTCASLLCGLATSPLFLNLARGAQGIGGALMFATSLALLAQEFQGRERGTAFGAWGATTGAAVAVGPLVGGALTDAFGWEWIFFVNVPIGIATATMVRLRVPESRDPAGKGIDWLGVTTFSAALFLLVLGLIRGNADGWGSPRIVSLFVAAAALLVVFVAVELRGSRPMLDLSLFRKPAFAGASIAAFTLSAAMFAMFLYITLYIQDILGFSPLEAGLRFLPVTLLAFAAAPIAGKLSAQLPIRIFLGGGLLLVCIGLLLMHGVTPSSEWTALLLGFCVAGVGIGMVNPPLASAAVGVVEPQRSGMASGINSTFRQVGIATGIAALGAIFQARIRTEVDDLMAGPPGASAGRRHALADAVANGGTHQVLQQVPASARHQVADVARQAFVSGLNEILIVAAIVAFVGAILAAALVRSRDFVVSRAREQAAAA